MKPTDFAYHLTNFLSKYLPAMHGASTNTINSYRDAFVLLLHYMKSEMNLAPERLCLQEITKERIEGFLGWLENIRGNSVSTRNNRLAAIHAFFQYLQYEHPEQMHEWQRILSIPVKSAEKHSINYLTLDAVRVLLSIPDLSTARGRRDLTLLSLMYDTAARVQEIIDLTPGDIRLDLPCTVRLLGKGQKVRIIPVLDAQMALLRQYMHEHRLNDSARKQYPLFSNSQGKKLTRAGVNYILQKYISLARAANPQLIPDSFSCHGLRHSKSMHLLQAGVNLVYIRDILGHVSIQTTEVYARADSKQKRDAIEKAYVSLIPESEKELPMWEQNQSLLEWLKGLE